MKKTLFDELFWNGFGALENFNVNYSSPKITSKDGNLLLEIALPGYSKDEVNVTIEGRTLIIEANIESSNETYFKKPFKKMYELNEKIDTDNIEAKLENGLLTLKMIKSEKITKINIL